MWRFGVPYVLVMPLVSSGISWKGDMLRKATKLFVYTVLYSVQFFILLFCHCIFFVLRDAQGNQRKVKRKSGSHCICLLVIQLFEFKRANLPRHARFAGSIALLLSYLAIRCWQLFLQRFNEIIVVRGSYRSSKLFVWKCGCLR